MFWNRNKEPDPILGEIKQPEAPQPAPPAEEQETRVGVLFCNMEKDIEKKWVRAMFFDPDDIESGDAPRAIRPQIRDLCFHLYHTGQPLPLKDVPEIVQGNLEKQTTTKIVEKDGVDTGLLEIRKGGFNRRTGKPLDSRCKMIHLTPEGKQRMDRFLRDTGKYVMEKIQSME